MNIVAAIKNGDHQVFRQVFEQYHRKLYYFMLSKTRSEYVAEEVMQLAFIKLWESRHTLNEDYTISTQLYRMAYTLLIDQLRRQSTGSGLMQELETITTEPVTDGVNEKMREKELLQKLTLAMNALPPVRRQVFEMSRGQGLSYKEIADALSVSVKTVETHMSKALKQIKKYVNVLFVLMVEIFF